MKRDPRLRGLSSEHHRALVLARTLTESTAGPELAALLAERFVRELEPHFQIEEAFLFPALRAAGAGDLVDRAEADHAFLRAGARQAAAGEHGPVGAFAERLREHVRFEERELFPQCESLLAATVLDELARHAPKDE